MNARSLLLVAVAGAIVLGCGGEDATGPAQPQPQPGQLQVTLSGGVPAGGLVLTVTGEEISAPAALSGGTLYYDLSASELRAVVVASSLTGPVLRFSVPDVREAGQYQASLQQVAGTDNEPRLTTAHAVSVSVVP